jgi:hypothetical protein
MGHTCYLKQYAASPAGVWREKKEKRETGEERNGNLRCILCRRMRCGFAGHAVLACRQLVVRVVRPRNRQHVPPEHGGLFRHTSTKGVAGVFEGDSVRRGFVVCGGEGKLPRLAVVGLNHVSIETSDVARLRAFYAHVVGLQELKRPDFGFGGAWLQLSPSVALHIIERDPLKPEVRVRARWCLSLLLQERARPGMLALALAPAMRA